VAGVCFPALLFKPVDVLDFKCDGFDARGDFAAFGKLVLNGRQEVRRFRQAPVGEPCPKAAARQRQQVSGHLRGDRSGIQGEKGRGGEGKAAALGYQHHKLNDFSGIGPDVQHGQFRHRGVHTVRQRQERLWPVDYILVSQ
jgi:hypothetical protein